MNNIFAIFPPLMFIFIIGIIIIGASKSTKRKKVVLKEEVVNKYKSIAYDLIKEDPDFDKARLKYKGASFLSFVFFVLAFVSLFLSRGIDFRLGVLSFVACIAIFIILLVKRSDKAIFSNVLPKVLKKFNKDINYDHYKKMDRNVYREARYEGFDRYSSDDYITGKILDTSYEMAEVHTERRHTDSEGRTYYTTVFHGMFAKFNLNKNFGSYLAIVNNQIKLFNRDQYVTIDNEEFEKIYDVFTDDKIKTMRLLTPDVTTKMIDIYNDTGLYFDLKIYDNVLYLRLYTSSMFNFKFSNIERETKDIANNIAKLDSIYKIAENIISEIERFDV